MRAIVLAAAFATSAICSAHATPVTFFGEDIRPGAGATPNSVAAQADFLANLSSGVGIEDFESATLPDIEFLGSTSTITATLTGGETSIFSSRLAGTSATSGSNYVRTGENGDFTVSFNTAISAFGFFGTDIGDFGNTLVLQLTDSNGAVSRLDVAHTLGASGSTNGSVLYFGFIDTSKSYTKIAFENLSAGGDVFGFDDLTVGDVGQIIEPPAVPLPAAGWMLLAGLGGLGAMRRVKG